MTKNEQKLFDALAYLVEQVEEDVNPEYMTKHTKTALEDACCLLYTSPSPRDRQKSRMPSSA